MTQLMAHVFMSPRGRKIDHERKRRKIWLIYVDLKVLQITDPNRFMAMGSEDGAQVAIFLSFARFCCVRELQMQHFKRQISPPSIRACDLTRFW